MLLVIDTSGPFCAAGVITPKGLSERCEEMTRGQAERLMPMVEEVLAEAGATLKDLTAIAVCTGPGNFTGIRIAVALSRGLSFSLGLPAVGVGALEAAAFGTHGSVTVAREGRGQFITQSFRDGTATAPATSADTLPKGAILAGVDLSALATAARGHLAAGSDIPRPAPIYLRLPDAAMPSEPPPTILDA